MGEMEHLDEAHIEAFEADLEGAPIVKNGKVYDHYTEVTDALSGARRNVKSLERSLDNPKLTPSQRAVIQRVVDKARSVISRIDKIRRGK
jgi:hypothetical protein